MRCLRSIHFGDRVLRAVPERSAFTINGGAPIPCARVILGPQQITFVQSNGETLHISRGNILKVDTYDADLKSFCIRREGGVSIPAPKHHLVLSHAPPTQPEDTRGPLKPLQMSNTTDIWPLAPLFHRTSWAWRPSSLHRATSRDREDGRTLFELLQDILRPAMADNSAASVRQSCDRARFPLAFKPYVASHLLEPVYLTSAEARYTS